MRHLTALLAAVGLLATAAAADRAPIYTEDGKGMERVEAALDRAGGNGARVLLKIGGNWCGWCFLLHDVFHNEPSVREMLEENYEVVLVDNRYDKDVLEKWKIEPQGYPYLTVLDASGKKLTEQETGSLEIGPKHDPAKVVAFLEKWKPEPRSAQAALDAALARAKQENKKVFVRVGAPWCGWCRRLDAFVAEPEVRTRLEKDFVLTKLDLDEMEGAKAVVERLRKPEEGGGIPWFAFLNPDGTILITSTNASGTNVGFPVDPASEIPHFEAMLNKAKTAMTGDDVRAVIAALRQAGQAARQG